MFSLAQTQAILPIFQIGRVRVMGDIVNNQAGEFPEKSQTLGPHKALQGEFGCIYRFD
ncbi:hypothetical protein [Pseudophaeobacter leonis]|uniref:hypothetical protein n=1 Tax=Pseudophaeobacter leonis TaxID=1144477 RepID=UPI0013747FED|nr:hypothetical protein [Pseudophaeobacter leonis]